MRPRKGCGNMNNAVSILVAILIFGFIVLIHELGHFLFAIKNGIVVEEFAIGMGPKIISKPFKGTAFSIRAIPFGGFCRMLGEDVGSSEVGSFSSKTVWQRFQVIVAGPLFNFILAFLFAIIYVGLGYTPTTTIDEVIADSPAQAAGLQSGDQITRVNGRRVMHYNEISIYINTSEGETVSLEYKRGSEKTTLEITPRLIERDGRTIKQVGIAPMILDKSNVFEILKASVNEIVFWIKMVYYSLGMMISGNVSANDVAGPVGIVSVISDGYKESAKLGFVPVIYMISYYMVLLSANLGVMNLLPIPALDGGRLVFIGLEAIRRKPINPDKEGFIHFVGYVLLMGLMVLILFNDIVKAIKG